MTKVEKNESNMDKCTCGNCPSYNECAKGKTELLYCAEEVGKSSCEFQRKGCVCGSCPVQKDYGLNGGYYCLPK